MLSKKVLALVALSLSCCLYGSHAHIKSQSHTDVDLEFLTVACGADGIGNGQIESLKKLIQTGANVNRAISAGHTALMHNACKKEQLPVLQLLLELGADVNAQDKHGSTALHYAMFKHNADAMRSLLLCNADISISNQEGISFAAYLEPIKEEDSVDIWTLKELCLSVYNEAQAQKKELADQAETTKDKE